MGDTKSKYFFTVILALLVNAIEASVTPYLFASRAGADPISAVAAPLMAAIAAAFAIAFIAAKKGAVLKLDLPEIADEEEYRRGVDAVGAIPFKLFLIFVGIGLIGAFSGTAASILVFGNDAFKTIVLSLLNLSFQCVLGSFLYVVLDRTVLRHLLAFKLTRFPAALRELRQRRKNIIIPIFMTIMALAAAFSFVLMILSGIENLAAMAPLAILAKVGAAFLPASAVYVAVILALVLIWAGNTSILFKYVLERLDQIASTEKDLTSRIHIASVDEIASIEGRINDFTETLQKSFMQVRDAFDTFAEIEGRLVKAVEKSAEAEAELARRIAATAEAAEKVDALAADTLEAEEDTAGGVQSVVRQISSQRDRVSDSVSAMKETIAATSSAAATAADVRGRVARLVTAFSEGDKSVRLAESAVKEVVGLSEKLREINEIIAGIAARTNLLAMNAAIEAAHAGSAGAGFSVVADEIRALAENTAKRTRESKESLKAVLDQIGQALGASEKTAASFASISELLGGVDTGASEIAAIMAEQDRAGEKITSMLEETTKLSEETLRIAQELGESSQTTTNAVTTVGAEAKRLSENARMMRERNAVLAAAVAELEDAAAASREVRGRAAALINSFKT